MKKFFFFLTLPFMMPLTLFMNATFDWWTKLAERNKILFVVLLPIYGPLALIMNWLFEGWAKLAD